MKNKKKVKSKKGFTLIELLGTIVIIGLLGTIAIASVVNIKKSTNARFDNSQVELMKQAGQTYFTDNKRLLPIVEGQTNFVTLDELIEKGYINKLYNSKKEEFDAKDSYVWVQKQDNGSYKYNCYCTIKGIALAGTTVIPKSEANNTTITFEYVGDFYNANKKHYTNGKSDASVRVSLIREEVSKYRYEIYKSVSEDNGKFVQYKVSQRDNLTASTVNIKLKAKDYSEGEYYILVTAYNKSGRAIQSIYSDGIYVDKTPPTCSIKTDYERDSDSVKGLWYSSNSENNNNQKLGENQKLPIYVDGSDNGSGIKDGSRHIFSNSRYTAQLDNGTGTYNAGNTEKNGTDYYATIEDNVGNKAKCSQLYYIDTKPPTCKVNPVSPNPISNTGWYNANSTLDANLIIELEQDDNVEIPDYGLTTANYIIYNRKSEASQDDTDKNGVTWYGYVKDQAGNTNNCSKNFKVDIHYPTVDEFKLTSSDKSYNTVYPQINITVYDKINDTDDTNEIKYGFYSDSSTELNDNDRTYYNQGDNTYAIPSPLNRIDEFKGKGYSGYDGSTYNIGVSVIDAAGNITEETTDYYEVYTLCSDIDYSVGDYGACSDTCGGGVQYAPEIYKDSHTNDSCGKTDDVYEQYCNEDECPDDEYDNECDSDDGCDTSDKLTCPKITSKTKAEKWTKKEVTFNLKFTDSKITSYDYYTKNLSDKNPKYTKQATDSKVTTTTRKLTAEGKRKGKFVIKDSNGNTKNCYTKTYFIDKTPPDVPNNKNITFSTTACNNQSAAHYAKFVITDELSGLKTGQFKWSTTNKINAGETAARSGTSHTECIATSASNLTELKLSYKVCDTAGNCNTSSNWK